MWEEIINFPDILKCTFHLSVICHRHASNRLYDSPFHYPEFHADDLQMNHSSLVNHAAWLQALENIYLHGLRELQALQTQVNLTIEQSRKGIKIPSNFPRPELPVSFTPLKPLHIMWPSIMFILFTTHKTISSFCFKLAKTDFSCISPWAWMISESQTSGQARRGCVWDFIQRFNVVAFALSHVNILPFL